MDTASDRWEEVDALFAAALDRPAAGRLRFVAESCGDDTELRQAVERLLVASEESESFWPEDAGQLVDRVRSDLASDSEEDWLASVPVAVGPYRFIERIGRGGMGSVYLAERADGAFEHRVAIKLLRSGLDSDEIARRFRTERQILASLDHPNIARLVDGGTTSDGRPFLVMEYIEGIPITKYCDEQKLTVAERLRLFEIVLRAVQHAHSHLVIHRDLKPSNILVTREGIPKLLDFGIAKLLDDDGDSRTRTRTGVRLMTPGYASPEQIEGETITIASDVFQLGLLLYELLAGSSPFGGEDGSPRELERRIVSGELERPSRRVQGALAAQISAARSTDPNRLRRTLAGDLDDIAAKALRREPEKRYASAEQLLADLDRRRRGRPVFASSGAARYRAAKFIGRHSAALSVAGAFVVLILAAFVVLRAQRDVARAAASEAAREAETARQVTAFVTSVFGGSDPEQTLGDTVTARILLERGVERVDAELADQPEVRAEMLHVMGSVYKSLGSYEQAVSLLDSALAIRRALYGPEHEKVAESLEQLGEAYRGDRAFADAEPRLREAVAIRRALHGPDDPRLAASLERLAQTLRDIGKPDSALVLAREALAIYEHDPGPDSPKYVAALAVLAYVLRATGDHAEAERLYRELIPKQRELFGSGSPRLASSLNNLAYILELRGEHAEAALFYREALDVAMTVYGRGHRNSLTISGNLIQVWLAEGNLEAALAVATKDVEAVLEQWPEGHWQVGAEYQELGIVYMLAGNHAAAESPFGEAFRNFERELGPTHSWTARAGAWLATSQLLQGRIAEAAKLFETSLTTLRIVAGDRGFPASERHAIEFFADFLADHDLTAESTLFRDLIGQGGREGDDAPTVNG